MPAERENNCLIIILAAGEGKRMASSMPKVLHPVAGLPMVAHVLKSAAEAGATKRAVVVGNQAERVAGCVREHDSSATIHIQHERKGTAHATLAAREVLEGDPGDVLVLYGDVPLIRAETLHQVRAELAAGNDIVVLGFKTDNPSGYGRLLVEKDQLIAIREEKDASLEEKSITLCNSGIIAISGRNVLDVLDSIGNDNAQSEYYLTDAVEVGRAKGLSAIAIEIDEEETLGVNDRIQLAQVEAIWQRRRREAAMRSGVTMPNPESVIFHHDTLVERDAAIEANVVFAGNVQVAQGATIRAFSHLEGAQVGRDAIIGPYARLRPGTKVGTAAKIGNFVETKNTDLGEGAKINHLSYVGDATVGAGANIGAGTITCNYDGFNKHHTTIGAGAFIGSNTALVAPVLVGQDANTAAGSTIVNDIPDDALSIARGRQVNKEGRAKKLRSILKARKDAATKA